MQPPNPNSQYDFILNADQKPKNGFFSDLGLPRWVVLGGLAAVILIVLIVLYSVAFGNKSNNQPVLSLAAQAQEISRVSTLVSQTSTDSNTVSLATTVITVLTSQQTGLTNYYTSTGHKLDTKLLAVDKNDQTDQQIQSANQSNSLTSFYESYLKASLSSYGQALASEYKLTRNPDLKPTLDSDYQSVQTILNSPELKP